jgi:hypothetical protein
MEGWQIRGKLSKDQQNAQQEVDLTRFFFVEMEKEKKEG